MIISTLIVLFIIKVSKKAIFTTPTHIRGHYGEQTLRTLRRIVKLTQKLIKTKLDIRFLTKCIMYNLAPKMVRFKLHKESSTSSKLAQRFRVNILRAEIKYHQRRIQQLEKSIKELEDILFPQLSFIFRLRVKAFIKKSVDNFQLSCTEAHNRKLKNLGLNISHDRNDSAIFNDTNVSFDDDEIELLSMGLKHSFFPTSVNIKSVQVAFEDLFVQISPFVNDRNRLLKLKACIFDCYNDYIGSYFHDKRSDHYFSSKVHDTIKSIQAKLEKYNLVIVKADKGNTVVILNRETYVKKMMDILNDNSKFEEVEEEDTLDRLSKFQSFVYRHHKNGVFTDEEYKKLYPSAGGIPVMYGLPKIHKTGSPLRPILSMVGTLNHGLAKWLASSLGEFRQAKSMAKNSFSLTYLAESELTDGHFVSIDVVSLFTNIPVDETINVILEALYPKLPGVDAKDQKFRGMTKLIFRRSLEWCLKGNIFIFNGKYYKQTDGCAMGSPLAPILADIFMNYLLEPKIIRSDHDHLNLQFSGHDSFEPFSIKLFIRYVDDTLVVFNNPGDADRFISYLNSLHPNMRFTMEHEVLDRLAFLDLLLIKDHNNNKLEITVYRKPTHSGVFTHFTSFVPYPFKVGLINTLLTRAYRICSSWSLFHSEVERLKSMLQMNGYTSQLIESKVGLFLNKKFNENSRDEESEDSDSNKVLGPDQFSVYIELPYIGDTSNKIRNCLNSCLSKIKCGSVQIKFMNSFTRLRDVFKFKDRQPSHLKSDVVYLITCSCGRKYVGETCRNVKVRFDEHMKTSGTGLTEVGKHLLNSPNCKITFDDCKVLGYESYNYRRKLKESLFIQQLDDGSLLNDKLSSVPLFIFGLPSVIDQGRGRLYPRF